MMKRVAVWGTCFVLVLVFAEVAMAQQWLEKLGREIGIGIGKQIAAEMGRQALQELVQKDDNFKAFVEALQAGRDVCESFDKEYGPGTCAKCEEQVAEMRAWVTYAM